MADFKYIGPEYNKGLRLDGDKVIKPASWSQAKIKKQLANNTSLAAFFSDDPEAEATTFSNVKSQAAEEVNLETAAAMASEDDSTPGEADTSKATNKKGSGKKT